MTGIFTRIDLAGAPERLAAGDDGFAPPTVVAWTADGDIPFPQVVLRRPDGGELLLNGDAVRAVAPGRYEADLPGGTLRPGVYEGRVEGCRRADWRAAGGEDWVKAPLRFEVAARTAVAPASGIRVTGAGGGRPKLYFGIHKHMHQPYYRAADPGFWDGQVDGIFAERAGPYRSFVALAARQYRALPHAGLSMSWSGSLVEQLDRCSAEGRCGGAYGGDWKGELREVAAMGTEGGGARARFSAFGFFHPLMPLVPERNIVKQILWHRDMVKREFGVEASRILFPPETAFHVRMIPALKAAGIDAVIYDSIHRYRASPDYPYAGPPEGMLPPSRADQANPPAGHWLQLKNVWAASRIAPHLLRPEYVHYVDPDGAEHRIVAVPAERYLGNEDARGGFGALVYPDTLGQVLDSIVSAGLYDPEHPPFFLLHSDGDNYGGGADSYYGANTGRLVEWLRGDDRFELTAIEDYLGRFPPDPASSVHLEPGSWSGADNGDPQFMKWFGRYRQDYSPDLNSWAVLTALQNAVHTLEDAGVDAGLAERAARLMLTAETSCYWYWTGQDIWDQQVTDAANAATAMMEGALAGLAGDGDRTGPTIFPPWVYPENPGGKTWGDNCLADAAREARVHTFIDDVSGVRTARLLWRGDAGAGAVAEIPLVDRGPYPCRTDARRTARLYTADLPVGAGDIRYWIEAEDRRGNRSRGALERVFLA